jgi:hypothetical protein
MGRVPALGAINEDEISGRHQHSRPVTGVDPGSAIGMTLCQT